MFVGKPFILHKTCCVLVQQDFKAKLRNMSLLLIVPQLEYNPLIESVYCYCLNICHCWYVSGFLWFYWCFTYVFSFVLWSWYYFPPFEQRTPRVRSLNVPVICLVELVTFESSPDCVQSLWKTSQTTHNAE